MKKITLQHLLFVLFCVPSFLIAQDKNATEFTKCFTDEYNAQLLESNPNMMGSDAFRAMINTKIAEQQASGELNRRIVVTIPLVVHVLHNGEPIGSGPNITDAQVLSQVTVMNEDFRRMFGSPGYNTHVDGADAEVEFVMAQRTPNGCATNGINRVNICQDGTDGSDVAFWKGQTTWNRDLYMNMWSSKYVGDLSGILGFAQFPGGPAATDGVSAGHTFFGSSDYNDGTFNLSAPYDKGRTMTHEVGHFLGLLHTFQGGCAGGDGIADTPAVDNPNYGCPTGHMSCGTTDMIENYMDYTDDACMNIFTNGQKAVIQAVLASTRSGLGSSNGATPLSPENVDAEVTIECFSAVPCSADISADIKITNWGTNTLTAATIAHDVDGGSSTNYNWSGSLAYGEYDIIPVSVTVTGSGTQNFNASISNANGGPDARACNDMDSKSFSASGETYSTSEIHLALTTDNWSDETSWEFKNEIGTVLYSGGPYNGTTDDNTTFNETFTLTSTGCYTFTIFDAYADGICCAYGNGSYELQTGGGDIIFNGGTFGASEDTNIVVNSLSIADYFLNNSVSLYPNPATNVLNIKVTDNNMPDSYSVYNMLGQIIRTNQINNNGDLTVNTSSLSNGMYFIQITKEGNSISLPFIKR